MAGKTISFVKGKGSLRHNNRDFIASNVDPERTQYNVTYVRMTQEEAYEKCFGEALREYNEGQKRKDRRKENYLEEIKHSGNNEKVFYENVVQIGTMKDTPVVDENGAFTEEGKVAAEILDDYARTFQERNPNLFLFNAVLHLDEATPHLHLDYIPVAHGYKRGLKTRNSLTKALQEMGFEKGKNRMDNETIDWQKRERGYITDLCEERGIEVRVIGIDRDDYSLPEYKEIMQKISEKEAEIEILNSQKQEAVSELDQLQDAREDVITEAKEAKAQIESEIRSARAELSQYELTRDVMSAVDKEIKAEMNGIQGQVIPSRNPLDKEEYVKVPKKLWDRMTSAYEWSARQRKTIGSLTAQIQKLKSKVSDLSSKIRNYKSFIEKNGMAQVFEEFLHPKKQSVMKRLDEIKQSIQKHPVDKIQDLEMKKKPQKVEKEH